MNQLRDWLYGSESQNRWPPDENKKEDPTNLAVATETDNIREKSKNNITDSKVRSLLLKVVPLQPGDCLGCKLVGTGVMAVSGLIVLTSAVAGRARNPNLFGRRLLMYHVVCGCLFVGCETAAFCRFFDVGPFAKNYDVQRERHSAK